MDGTWTKETISELMRKNIFNKKEQEIKNLE